MNLSTVNTTGFYPLTALCLVPQKRISDNLAEFSYPEQVTRAVGLTCSGGEFVSNHGSIFTVVCEDRGDHLVACSYIN